MAFHNTIHGGGAPMLTESVYYTGSDTLLEGYCLCYDFNAADVDSENNALTSINVGEEVWADARRVLVEKPTEGNKLHFAGVVAAQSDGVTGPGWVTIHKPGSVCNVYTYSDVDHEVAGAGSGQGQVMGLVVGQWYMQEGAFPGSGAAMVLQDVDRSSTAGLVMAELMTGLPSGGINHLTVLTTTSGGASPSLSDVCNVVPTYAGIYNTSIAAASTTLDNILSVPITAADGRYAGKRVKFIASTTITGLCASIWISAVVIPFFSSVVPTTAPVSIMVELSAASEYATLQFNGTNWTLESGHEAPPG